VKLIYLVIDGAPDSLQDEATSLEKANKPYLDSIARKGKCGAMYTIAKGIAPESDSAVLSILSYDPFKCYTGRGPIEAIGADMVFKEGFEVAFRANFATVDPKTLKIIDRRVGRSLRSWEARELAKALDGLELGIYDAYVKVKATVAHRAVVIIGSKSHKLSSGVENTDPAYRRKGQISIAVKDYKPYIMKSKPLVNTLEAKITAELVNTFTLKAIQLLDEHPINKERARKGLPKANAILLRDAGTKTPKIEPINKKFNLKFGAIAEMPVELGIAKILGMEVEKIKPRELGEKVNYNLWVEKTLKLLDKCDIAYVHIKGPDEPGHDGDFELKVKIIEEIDQEYIRGILNSIDLNEVAILVTSDHSTPPSRRAHTDDPVPFTLYYTKIKADAVTKFTERECLTKGAYGVIDHGWKILPLVITEVFK